MFFHLRTGDLYTSLYYPPREKVYNSVPQRWSVENSPKASKNPAEALHALFATSKKQNQDLGSIVLLILKIRKLKSQSKATVLFEVRFSKGLGEKLLGISDRYFSLQ